MLTYLLSIFFIAVSSVQFNIIRNTTHWISDGQMWVLLAALLGCVTCLHLFWCQRFFSPEINNIVVPFDTAARKTAGKSQGDRQADPFGLTTFLDSRVLRHQPPCFSHLFAFLRFGCLVPVLLPPFCGLCLRICYFSRGFCGLPAGLRKFH